MFVSSLDGIEIIALYAPTSIVMPHTFDNETPPNLEAAQLSIVVTREE